MEGHWVQTVAFDNMDDILDAVGIADDKIRGMILSIKPEIELTHKGDQWEYKLITPQTTRTVMFTSGETVDYCSIVGRPVKAEMTISGDELREVHTDPNDVNAHTYITRQFNGNTMTTTIKVKDIVAVGKYEKA